MHRTGRGPLRPIWWLSYTLCLRGVAALLRSTCEATVYVTGSFAQDQPVFGLSDVDLVVVAPATGEPTERARLLRERWRQLCRRLPVLSLLVTEVSTYQESELSAAASSTCLNYGLDGHSPEGAASFFGTQRLADEAGLKVRPGLWPTRTWRLIAGPDVRPTPVNDPESSRLRAWLELQFWWRFAFDICVEPEAREVSSFQIPYLCVKLVAEPVRILLWFVHGERVLERKAVLERARELFPAEEPAIHTALELLANLHRSPSAKLADFLPTLVRFSSRLAEAIAADLHGRGVVEVALVGGNESTGPLGPPLPGIRPAVDRDRGLRFLPLADWLARCRPRPREEAFALGDGDPCDRQQLAAAVRNYRPGMYLSLRADRLIVFPATAPRRLLRSVQCAHSDPVSFALAGGLSAASFPNVPGWSALHCAGRAVAEHRGWLESRGDGFAAADYGQAVDALGMLLSAARAALFLESVQSGEPKLAVTFAAATELLASDGSGGSTVAAEGYAEYRDAVLEGRAPSNRTLTAFFKLVTNLPAYRTAAWPRPAPEWPDFRYASSNTAASRPL